MLTADQVKRYLERIGCAADADRFGSGALACDMETLSRLTFAHQCAVPFETVSIYRSGKVPCVEVDALFDKLVTRRLGGFCFELNKLFEELLRTLGFDVRPCLCRAVRGRDGRMPINHRGILALIDGAERFADVGFGGPMAAGALTLVDGAEQAINDEHYTPRRGGDGWWRIDRVTRSSFDLFDDAAPVRRQTELEVCEAAVEDIDFDALNVAFSQPGTLFRDHMVVNLRTTCGHKSIMDYKLTLRENGHKRVVELADDAELARALDEHFGMVF
ncbi:MAG: arylamine N-acetyltransferase [Eggerthellaceae bacterium]|nr:arylamine N-acetyltransferase [Eggerthellaceae bacterium]